MTDKEAMKLSLDALEWSKPHEDAAITHTEAIAALKERLAQEKALQSLHSENERLGLYKDAYAEQAPVAQYSDIVSDGGLDPRNKFDVPPKRTEPVCPACKAEVLYECVACSSNNYPPKSAEPIISLQCANCQVTIETLNDKVMHLLAERKPLTDEEAFKLVEQDNRMEEYAEAAVRLIRRTEAAHGIKENT